MPIKVIWVVQSPSKKYSASLVGQISGLTRPSHPIEGRLAIVTNVRWDAVDAEAPLTNGADADGEVVWSWRPDAGVKLAEVTPPATVARKPVAEESAL